MSKNIFLNIFSKYYETTIRRKATQEDGRNHNACPLCGVIFDPIPKRKIKCSSCNVAVYVRSRQTLFNSDLLTEDQALTSDFFSDLEYLGASKEQYNNMNEVLSIKYGFNAKPYDIAWKLSNEMVIETSEKYGLQEGILHLSMVYAAQANFLESRNIDPYIPRLLMNETEFNRIEHMPDFVSGVEIITKDCCVNCSKMHSNPEALDYYKNRKLLPYKNCTRKLKSKDKHSWCICYYSPVINKSGNS